MQKNYYQILRIKHDATPEQVGEAYHRALDRVAQSGIEDADTLALLREAHESLADPRSREAYDQSLLEPPPPPPRLRTVAAPPADFSADDDDGFEPSSRGERRKWIGIAVAAASALLTVFIGVMFMGKSSAPVAPAATVRVAKNTSSIPVSSEPLSTGPAAGTAPQQNLASTGPRTGDQVFAEVANSVVRVVAMDESNRPIGGGSGVVTARGTVITNCHVALKGPILEVKAGRDSFPASVWIADETYDLCQLAVSGGFAAPSVEVGNMQYVRTGQKVFAVGSPQGLDLTISEGIVSSLRETSLGKIVQTTAPISPGSSGGGLFNVSGQLIGITTFQMRSGQNLNFAVPADWIADMTARGGTGPSLQ